ncbi:MAG: toxin-antitoxin system [Pseudomonadota bacterium]|nr:toxin-antitoxin system [Pseudomonadota bacterium]
MAQLIVRNIDDDLKSRLKDRAYRHGQSMEEEVRSILREAVRSDKDTGIGIGTELSRLFSQLDFDPDIQELRGYPVEPFTFGK